MFPLESIGMLRRKKIDVNCESDTKRVGKTKRFRVNTLRTGDADLRFYITTVQD